jgi:outer membrane autotransporter protein
LHQNDFAESGANSIDIVTQGTQADAFRGLLGARILANLVTNSGLPVTWESRAAWRHEFLNETSLIDASFADQTGGAFAIAGINVDRDNAILGTSLTLQIRSNFSVFAGYDVVTSQNYTAHAGSGGLQYLW